MKQRLQSLESVLTQLQPGTTSSTSSGNAVKDQELLRHLKQSRKHLQNLQQEHRELKENFNVFKAKPGFRSVSAQKKDDNKRPQAVVRPHSVSPPVSHCVKKSAMPGKPDVQFVKIVKADAEVSMLLLLLMIVLLLYLSLLLFATIASHKANVVLRNSSYLDLRLLICTMYTSSNG